MATPKPERLKAADVCQIAQVQPYVLRTWEAEFPDLGKSTAGGPRLYSRADVERVLQIRALVYGEGLTLSGARRRLEEAAADATAAPSRADFSLLDATMRDRLKSIRAGLVGVLALLERPVGPDGFTLVASPERPVRRVAVKAARRTGR
jgi:DNA-binding transcriptional MerR regulator